MTGPVDATTPALAREDAERLLASCAIHRDIGLELADWEPGRVRFLFRPPASVRSGEAGVVHGGALATALDTAACFAVIAAVGVDCATVDLRTDFLRPAAAPELVVTGTLLRAGRRFGWADASVTAPDGRVLATARGTFTW
ncbi:PaaI family thioesterase [bacterium]|nr:MAG: PaaI family thioesterase [bacterium]